VRNTKYRKRATNNNLIMQNKANFQKARMNLNFYSKKEYENGPASTDQKNKANQSQFLYQKNPLIVYGLLFIVCR
jgi:hypothetical protein